MKHFIDEEYDSLKEYETNITNHYENNDYYDKSIIHYEPYPDDWYEGTIKHFQD